MNKTALTFTASLLLAAAAGAQEMPDTSSSPAAATAGQGRFRWGIDATGGLEDVSGGGASVSGPMFGLDARFGWQLNDMWALYAQPHLSFGSLSTSGAGFSISGGTSTFTGTVMGEATLAERFFAGAGVGYGILNNPSGLTVEARGGFYPLMSRDEDGRRKGLMLGVDFRSVFISGATGILAMVTVGYERF